MEDTIDLSGRIVKSMKSLEVTPIEEIDKILGTTSAQRVLRILICWQSLSLKEIVERADFSESQVHLSLTQLEKVQIVKKKRRGVYILADTPFVRSLTEAYTHLLVQRVGMEIYRLSKNLDHLSTDEISNQLDKLIFHWRPILECHFPLKLSSLVNYSINRYKEDSEHAMAD